MLGLVESWSGVGHSQRGTEAGRVPRTHPGTCPHSLLRVCQALGVGRRAHWCPSLGAGYSSQGPCLHRGGGRLPGESLAVPGPPLVSSFPGPGLLSASTRLHSPLLCYIPVRSSPSLMSPWGPPPSPPSGSGWRRPCVQTQKLLGGVCRVWRAGWTCKHARPRCQRGPRSYPGRPGRQACPGPWHQAGGRERLTVRP